MLVAISMVDATPARGDVHARMQVSPGECKPSAAIEPGDGALDDPAFGKDRKSADLIGRERSNANDPFL
jgi:hypothetical protein